MSYQYKDIDLVTHADRSTSPIPFICSSTSLCLDIVDLLALGVLCHHCLYSCSDRHSFDKASASDSSPNPVDKTFRFTPVNPRTSQHANYLSERVLAHWIQQNYVLHPSTLGTLCRLIDSSICSGTAVRVQSSRAQSRCSRSRTPLKRTACSVINIATSLAQVYCSRCRNPELHMRRNTRFNDWSAEASRRKSDSFRCGTVPAKSAVHGEQPATSCPRALHHDRPTRHDTHYWRWCAG